jgi:hypothetical protein
MAIANFVEKHSYYAGYPASLSLVTSIDITATLPKGKIPSV